MRALRSLPILVAAAVASVPAPAPAGPLAPSKPSQLVTARVVTTDCPYDDPQPGVTGKLIDEMATVEGLQQPFVIPPRQVLVVTSVQYAVIGTPGETFGLNLIAVNGTERAVLGQASVTTTAEGLGSLTLPIPTGVAVREGNALCLLASPGGTASGSVTGFFAKDK